MANTTSSLVNSELMAFFPICLDNGGTRRVEGQLVDLSQLSPLILTTVLSV